MVLRLDQGVQLLGQVGLPDAAQSGDAEAMFAALGRVILVVRADGECAIPGMCQS